MSRLKGFTGAESVRIGLINLRYIFIKEALVILMVLCGYALGVSLVPKIGWSYPESGNDRTNHHIDSIDHTY